MSNTVQLWSPNIFSCFCIECSKVDLFQIENYIWIHVYLAYNLETVLVRTPWWKTMCQACTQELQLFLSVFSLFLTFQSYSWNISKTFISITPGKEWNFYIFTSLSENQCLFFLFLFFFYLCCNSLSDQMSSETDQLHIPRGVAYKLRLIMLKWWDSDCSVSRRWRKCAHWLNKTGNVCKLYLIK